MSGRDVDVDITRRLSKATEGAATADHDRMAGAKAILPTGQSTNYASGLVMAGERVIEPAIPTIFWIPYTKDRGYNLSMSRRAISGKRSKYA